jgi:hypothetical protein
LRGRCGRRLPRRHRRRESVDVVALDDAVADDGNRHAAEAAFEESVVSAVVLVDVVGFERDAGVGEILFDFLAGPARTARVYDNH